MTRPAEKRSGLDPAERLVIQTAPFPNRTTYAAIRALTHSLWWQVLERAVRCGTLALRASHVDREMVALAGDALDDAEMLSNRSAVYPESGALKRGRML